MSHWCRHCGKEVHGFDHHCVFLNTCIGEGNYISFVALVVSLAVLELFHAIFGVVCIVRRRQVELFLLASILASGGLASTLSGLLVFQAYVRLWLRTSTYGWVLDRRQAEIMEVGECAGQDDERRRRREKARQAEYDHWLAEQATRKEQKKSDALPPPPAESKIELAVRNVAPLEEDPRTRPRRRSSPPLHSLSEVVSVIDQIAPPVRNIGKHNDLYSLGEDIIAAADKRLV